MYSIRELKKLIDRELNLLSFNEEPKDLYAPISYMLALDAKRMRPVLVLCGCNLFSNDISAAIKPALGIEVFHNFTLLHDDIMDNAPLRRSQQTVHTRWNPNVAILSGDTMFVKACQLMMMVDDTVVRQVLELFHKTAIEVCEGQQMDMDFEKKPGVTIPEYTSMITFKTAVLLGASLQTGAIIAGTGIEDSNHLYEFGKNIGIAFQLKDDLLDVFGDGVKFGKLKGGDIIANKKTFLLLKTMELATDDDKAELEKWISSENFSPEEKVRAITEIYEKLNIRHLAESEMEKYLNISLEHLNAVSVSDDRKLVLRGFAENLMVRET